MEDDREKESLPQELKKLAESFWGFLIFQRHLLVMLTVILIVAGFFSAAAMPKESTPEINVPFANVVTVYPGASPKEVADQVTFKLEQSIKGLPDLKSLTSSSSEGFSVISVEFDPKANKTEIIQKLKDRVSLARAKLPDDAEDPVVNEASFSNQPVITFGFFGKSDYGSLLDIVKKTRDEIEKMSEVERADILGERKLHILVAVREEDMRAYQLNFRQIASAIQLFNLNSPVGNVEIDELIYRLKIEAEQDQVELIKNIPLFTTGGATIYLKDVANIREVFKDPATLSLISVNGEPALSAISLSIVKKTGENIIETVDGAKATLETLKKNGVIPGDVSVLAVNDFSQFIRNDFDQLIGNAIQTLILIVLVLFVALGFKEALIASISIPMTFLIAFIYLKLTGNTFNSLVIFSLVLGLGLLVDTSIIMMEGVHENIHIKKMSPKAAALEAIRMYRFPLIAGTLTTIAAFLPMYLMSGIMGQFFAFIPRTVNAVLLASLFVGILAIPAFAAFFMKNAEEETKKQNRFSQWIQGIIEKKVNKVNADYQVFLRKILGSKKIRRWSYAITGIAFVSALALPITGILEVEGFPLAETDFIYLNAETPVGTSLEKTTRVMQQVESVVQKEPNTASYVLNIGTGINDDLSINPSNSNKASMTINFVDKEKRTLKSFEIAEILKKDLDKITDAKVKVEAIRSGPPAGSAIQVRIFGEDFAVLGKISQAIRAELERLKASNADDDIDVGTAEFSFDFRGNYEKTLLQQYGLNARTVAQEVRMAVFPTKVLSLKRGEEEVDIDLQRDWGEGVEKPQSLDSIKNLPIQNDRGQYITLGSLAEPTMQTSLNQVRHFDTKQVVTVSADPAIGQRTDQLNAALKTFLNAYEWPAGYSYELTGGNKDTEESFKDLFKAMLIGLLLIFMILVIEFNSFKQPFMVMTAVPLGLIGVFWGFALFGIPLGVGGFIGIVALSGVVVQTTIVLMDRINENRRSGMTSLTEAIAEAGSARLQPILITTITNVFGALPMALADPFWLGLGMAIAFGLLFSTMLTLILVPLLYYSLESPRAPLPDRAAMPDGLQP